MAFVLIPHLDPSHESMLGEILSRETAMPVEEAREGKRVEADRVYTIPPGSDMTIFHGSLVLMPRGESTRLHHPIDLFLRSLAEDCGSRAIGVVLSGTATDGSLGLKAVKEQGGITFAQDPASARYDGMPRSAAATSSVDFILPPDLIAEELARISRHPYMTRERAVGARSRARRGGRGDDAGSSPCCEARGEWTSPITSNPRSSDASSGAWSSSAWTVSKTINACCGRTRQNWRPSTETCSSTSPVSSATPSSSPPWRESVFPRILKGKSRANPVRIWVPGCSTGEEAYSIGIAWQEFLASRGPGAEEEAVQIFATDVSEACIDRARLGVYSEDISVDVSPERLRRFFTATEQGYQVRKSIRDVCVFARHNVVSDPPFSRIDLLSCRNLLIYMGSVFQEKIIPSFHYALNPDGFLMLGTAESIGRFADRFRLEDGRNKIYAKKTARAGPVSTAAYADRVRQREETDDPVSQPVETEAEPGAGG